LYNLPDDVFSVGNRTSDHYHRPCAPSLSAIVAQLPPQPPGAGLPLTLNTVAATGNSGASGNPVLQLANGGGLLDACEGVPIVGGDVEAIKAKEMETWQRAAPSGLAAEMEPELDQFM
jgi:hypothetical protein